MIDEILDKIASQVNAVYVTVTAKELNYALSLIDKYKNEAQGAQDKIDRIYKAWCGYDQNFQYDYARLQQEAREYCHKLRSEEEFNLIKKGRKK